EGEKASGVYTTRTDRGTRVRLALKTSMRTAEMYADCKMPFLCVVVVVFVVTGMLVVPSAADAGNSCGKLLVCSAALVITALRPGLLARNVSDHATRNVMAVTDCGPVG
ncbi:hypothetical protein BaRGS_00039200, partial [Batillaria attramentaria]